MALHVMTFLADVFTRLQLERKHVRRGPVRDMTRAARELLPRVQRVWNVGDWMIGNGMSAQPIVDSYLPLDRQQFVRGDDARRDLDGFGRRRSLLDGQAMALVAELHA